MMRSAMAPETNSSVRRLGKTKCAQQCSYFKFVGHALLSPTYACNRHVFDRHPGENRGPGTMLVKTWMPASAGMTKKSSGLSMATVKGILL
jgi:hypothetical protein